MQGWSSLGKNEITREIKSIGPCPTGFPFLLTLPPTPLLREWDTEAGHLSSPSLLSRLIFHIPLVRLSPGSNALSSHSANIYGSFPKGEKP